MSKATAILSFRNRASRRIWAGICLALFLALLVFSSSESLHKLIHPDADCSEHHCAVTMLAGGQVTAAEAGPLLVAFVAVLLFLLPLARSADDSSSDYRFSCSRAPPLA